MLKLDSADLLPHGRVVIRDADVRFGGEAFASGGADSGGRSGREGVSEEDGRAAFEGGDVAVRDARWLAKEGT